MRRTSIDLSNTRFFDNVGPRFDTFKKNMMKCSVANKIPFDEDVFMDTILSCAEVCPEDCTTSEDIDNYFWISYKQNVYNSKRRFTNDSKVDMNAAEDELIWVSYNGDIDCLYEAIQDHLEDEFGYDIATAWMLHMCDGYSIGDLKAMGYNIPNPTGTFRKVKAYVEKLSEIDNDFRVMLKNNNYNV